MGLIPANQARGLFTNMLIDTYKQIPPVKNFLKRFFPYKTSDTRYIYWAVRREGEPVAIDVLRGTEGNRNTFTLETDKIADPPYFNENFDITQTDLYYRAWSSDRVDDSMMGDWVAWVADHMMSIQNKVERAYELQRSNVLQTGKIVTADGTIIDFKRQNSSIIDLGAGNYFDNPSTDPTIILEQSATFLRTYGKADGGNFNVIMGQNAMNGFLNNAKVLARGRDFFMKLTDLQMPKMESDGAAYHGRVTAGSYTFDLWTYPQYFDAKGTGPVGNSTPFIDTTNMVVIPETPHFITGFGAVPFLPIKGSTGVSIPTLQKGAFVGYERMNQMQDSWVAGVKSAGLTLPTAIDQIFTAKVMAA